MRRPLSRPLSDYLSSFSAQTSPTTSFFAVFLAMLGKRRNNRHPRTVVVLLRTKVMADGRNPASWNTLACHRNSSRDTFTRLTITRVRSGAISLDNQPHHLCSRTRLCVPSGCLLRPLRSHCDVSPQLSLSDTTPF